MIKYIPTDENLKHDAQFYRTALLATLNDPRCSAGLFKPVLLSRLNAVSVFTAITQIENISDLKELDPVAYRQYMGWHRAVAIGIVAQTIREQDRLLVKQCKVTNPNGILPGFSVSSYFGILDLFTQLMDIGRSVEPYARRFYSPRNRYAPVTALHQSRLVSAETCYKRIAHYLRQGHIGIYRDSYKAIWRLKHLSETKQGPTRAKQLDAAVIHLSILGMPECTDEQLGYLREYVDRMLTKSPLDLALHTSPEPWMLELFPRFQDIAERWLKDTVDAGTAYRCSNYLSLLMGTTTRSELTLSSAQEYVRNAHKSTRLVSDTELSLPNQNTQLAFAYKKYTQD